jgi:hypothetical protein
MHEVLPVPTEVLDQRNTRLHWKECCSCFNVKPFGQFRTDSSFREGVRDQCYECESTPRLSTIEHTHRLRENTYSSEAVRAQRWGKDQLDCIDEEARQGRYRYSSEIYGFLKDEIPSLYFTDGNFIGDVSIYRTYGCPQPQLEGRTFQYLFYMPLGWMREYSIYEFDHRDVPVREKERGWRTVLLRFIKTRLLSESRVNNTFGEPYGPGSIHYQRQLWRWRNNKSD